MTDSQTLYTLAAIALTLCLVAGVLGSAWARQKRRAAILADKLAHERWNSARISHATSIRRAEASQRGRHARSEQIRQTRAKVFAVAAQLNREMGR